MMGAWYGNISQSGASQLPLAVAYYCGGSLLLDHPILYFLSAGDRFLLCPLPFIGNVFPYLLTAYQLFF